MADGVSQRMRNKETGRGKDRAGEKAREAQSVQGGERRGRGNKAMLVPGSGWCSGR